MEAVNKLERKTPEKIKEKIIFQLNNGPKSISEISDNIDSNWKTTDKFLNELITEERVIELISASKSKVYGSMSDLAWFYLPLAEDIRKKTLSLLYTLNEMWKKETNTIPQKTVLQKLAVKFVESNNLQEEIPVLRFHYGQTLALRFEEGITAEAYPLDDDKKSNIKELISEYKEYTSKEARLKQYEKDSMKFYEAKEKTFNNFCSGKEELLKKGLFNLFSNYPSELSESFKILDKLIYCTISTIKLDKEKEEYLSRLKETFCLIWDCLTTESYFYDIKQSISPDKEELFIQIKSNYMISKITNISNVVEEIENEINNLEPEEINISDNLSDFVHELFNE